MSEELAQLQSDIDAKTEAFLRKGGTVVQLNWAGVPIDGTQLEAKPAAAWGRNYERVQLEAAAKKPAPAVEAPPVKASPPVEVAPAPTTPNKVSVPVVDHPATERHLQRMLDVQDMRDFLAPQRLAYTVKQLRDLRADARRWLRRLDASFPR